MLRGFEYVPTKAEWTQLGPDAAVVLRRIAADPKALATHRGRAVSALAYFDHPDNLTALSTLLGDTKTPEHVKRKALLAAAMAYGDRAVPVIKPFAAAQSRDVRESAIQALGRINTPSARTVLEARLKLEPKAQLRDIIRVNLNPKQQPGNR